MDFSTNYLSKVLKKMFNFRSGEPKLGYLINNSPSVHDCNYSSTLWCTVVPRIALISSQ